MIAGIVVVALVLARAPAHVERDSSVNQSAAVSYIPEVSVIKGVSKESFVLPVHLTGNVTLEERVTVTSEARGKVIWVSDKFRAGETIAANEVFIRIDPTEYELRVTQVESRLKLVKLEHAAQQAQSAAAKMKRSAQTELFQTCLELAKRKLAQTEISLPYELRVIGADVEVGEVVGPHEYVGQEASVLGVGYRPEALQISAPIEPHILPNLNPLIGASATVAVGQHAYSATLERVASVVAPKSRLITIFLKFKDAAQAQLPLPGMFAEITLQGPQFSDSFVLPLTAMQSRNTAWVVDNGTLRARVLQSLALTDSQWIVAPFDVADGLVIGSYPGFVVGTEVQSVPVQ